ncbi:MAG: zeta toxin family protein [Alphaproteobacteria bacterium]|nr:zeta toxin family protein [Alphaproteobacteria bacterium]
MSSNKQPWLVIIAGPNGAGKTTFYENFLRYDPLFKNAPFVNLDNYAKELAGDENPDDYFFQAGREVNSKLNSLFENKQSCVYETTSSGRSHIKIMEEAKKRGYQIGTIFIGLSSVDLSHLRVQQRVEKGGHNVPVEDIERRYPKVIKNFPDMLARSDLAAVFDNSQKDPYKLIFLMDKYRFRIFYRYPHWVNEALKDRKTNKTFTFVNTKNVKKFDKEELYKLTNMIFSGNSI